MSSDDSARLQIATAFLDQFEAAGGWVNRDVLGLTTFDDMVYGAIALSDIPADTPLFHIPAHMTLSNLTNELRSHLTDAEIESLGHGWSPLILSMMWESSKSSSSSFAYYMDTMPASFDTPMLWSEDELSELKGTDLQKRIGRDEAESEYREAILPLVKARPDLFDANSGYYSLESFHVHGSRILSRSFTVSKRVLIALASEGQDIDKVDEEAGNEDEDDADTVTVMIPLADMLNASFGQDNARLFDDGHEAMQKASPKAGRGFTMVSSKPILRGDQIYNTYDSPPNSELLRKYGHVDEIPLEASTLSLLSHDWVGDRPLGNPADEVELEGDLIVRAISDTHSELSGLLTNRVDYWLEEGGEDSFYLSYSPDVDPDLISFTLILLDDTAWTNFHTKGKLPRPVVTPEVRAILESAVRHRLALYPSNIQTDLLQLATDRNVRRLKALVVRVGEKRVLLANLKRLQPPQPQKRSAPSDEQIAKRVRL